MTGRATLSDVADELYALTPEDFTAARDAAVRQARDDGDRELAAELKQLRRPSIGAWLINTLVRSDTDRLDELFDLGAALREAQDALDGAELRAMSKQRHEVIRALSRTAGDLAAKSGHRVGDTAQREFEGTLDAALADERAAHAVRTGRLMRTLSSTGLEAVDLRDAVAAPTSAPSSTRRTRTAAAPPKKQPTQPDTAAKQAAAKQAVRDARAELTRAEAELARRESDLTRSRTAVGQARERLSELDAALAEASEQKATAEKGRREADQAAKTAGRTRDAARRALDTAAKKLAR